MSTFQDDWFILLKMKTPDDDSVDSYISEAGNLVGRQISELWSVAWQSLI